MAASPSIVDPSDFCRLCRGKGVITSFEEAPYPAAYGQVYVSRTCDFCGGSGFRTVMVREAGQ